MKKGRFLTGASMLGLLAVGSAVALAQSETKTLQYDPLGRLTSAEVSGGLGNGDTRKLCYDSMGNRVSFRVRNDGSLPSCSAPTPTPTPTPTPAPTPTPTPTPSNSPPVTQDDTIGGQCSQVRLVNVTTNDSDPEGHYPLTVISVVQTSGLGAVLSFSGGIVEVVMGDPYDTSTYIYTVQDSLGASSTGTLTTSTGSCGGGVVEF